MFDIILPPDQKEFKVRSGRKPYPSKAMHGRDQYHDSTKATQNKVGRAKTPGKNEPEGTKNSTTNVGETNSQTRTSLDAPERPAKQIPGKANLEKASATKTTESKFKQ
jgi:hypothetical protein